VRVSNQLLQREEYSANSTKMFERSRRGQKLTSAQRLEIGYRRMEGESPMALALEYGVSRGTIDTCPKVERP
jgi:hypothetical protein